MASVFLSYDRDDADQARAIALALERAGHSVWWDLHVRGGAQFSKVIEEALKAADVVLVLWSSQSVESAWVRDEAAAGRDSGRLVPATIDGTEAPLGFRQFQTIDLRDWKRGAKSRGYRELRHAVQETTGDAQPVHAAAQPRESKILRRVIWPAAIALVAALGALAYFAWPQPSSAVPTVAVMAADRSAGAEGMARDLLVKLGSLQSAKTNAMRLVGGGDRRERGADFIFETSASASVGVSRANLALLAGKDRTVLWSRDFRQQGGAQADLEQQMAYTAGQVLDCAVEGSGPSRAPIDQDTLKLFLNGCALFAEKYRTDPQGVVPIFVQIIRSAPRFQPAWRKLLLAEALFTRTERLLGRSTPGGLPGHIAAARKLDREIPEVFVAESVLVPITAYARRSELLERAVRLDPDNPDLLLMRAEFYAAVGRMGEGVDDATRAVDLNPLSPGLRSHLIADLAYSGRIDTAQQELLRAEQLWPESAAIDDARFRLNNRYGDPKIALAMLKSGVVGGQPMLSPTIEAVLVARIEPTEANVRRAISRARSRASADTRALGDLVQVLGQFRREDELYEVLLQWPRADVLGAIGEVYFRPTLEAFRQDPRFMQVVARTGLVGYWQKSGKWPDFCFEPDLPYDCKKEAAKLAA